jgi:hypothetical protein
MTTQPNDNIDWRTEAWKKVSETNFEDQLAIAATQLLTVAKQKVVDDFLDTICCALEELSGKEVFDCFFEAVQSQFDYTKKEHNKTSELLDLLAGLK